MQADVPGRQRSRPPRTEPSPQRSASTFTVALGVISLLAGGSLAYNVYGMQLWGNGGSISQLQLGNSTSMGFPPAQVAHPSPSAKFEVLPSPAVQAVSSSPSASAPETVTSSPSLQASSTPSSSPPALSPSPSQPQVLPSPSPSGNTSSGVLKLPAELSEMLPTAFQDPEMWYRPTGADADLPIQLKLPFTGQDIGQVQPGAGTSQSTLRGRQLGPEAPKMQPVRGKIYVKDKGRLGNAMFMYAAGRALHELLGFELELEPGIVAKLSSFVGISSLPALERPDTWQPQQNGKDLTIVRHEVVDIFAIGADRSSRTITLNGYVHQMSAMKHFLAACRQWFQLKDTSTGFNGPSASVGAIDIPADSPITRLDVLMHLRAGDLTEFDIQEVRNGRGSGLVPMPFWWFQGVLQTYLAPPWANRTSGVDKGRLVAITEPGGDNGDAAKHLKADMHAIVVSRSLSEDFSALMHADIMIGSCSTFSWWAAALRRKSQVHMPAFGVCDPRWKLANAGAEIVDYDAGIQGWEWHDLFEMPNKPTGFDRGYRV